MFDSGHFFCFMKDPADYKEYSHSLLLKLALGDKTRELQNLPFNLNPSTKLLNILFYL